MSAKFQKLKVLHLIETLGSGGAERLLFTNLQHFDNDLVESKVVTVYSRGDYWKKEIAGLGVDLVSLNCKKYSDIYRGVQRLRDELLADSPDIIHTHLWTANVIGRIAGRASGIPVVSSIHSPEYESAAMVGPNKRKQIAAKQIDKWTMRFCGSRVIAVSKYVRDSVHAQLGIPFDKIEVLYNPVHLDESDAAYDRGQFYDDCGLPSDSVILLSIGRVSPEKGLIWAVKAMKSVVQQMPHAHLVHIGAQDNAAYLGAVRKEISDYGISQNVHFLGELKGIGSILSLADVFVFPSLFEGLGIALAEAMSAGVACVASDIKPLDEFVKDGQNGILVPLENTAVLADAILDLLRSPEKRQRIGAAARKTAFEMFKPGPAAERLTEIYQTVAHNK
ncbi:MAG TPA: glycosyltransferase family 4 protein [Pyrinomonadaceae bacterium]|nr:glycosyltransferase family 4 protein [Pyrinomonadaceae bacterium]